MNEVKFSIHFDENCEVVAVTEPPPEGIDNLRPAESGGEQTLYCGSGLEINAAPIPTILKTRDTAKRICCGYIYIPGQGWVKICWQC
jgi:hypothetical protein